MTRHRRFKKAEQAKRHHERNADTNRARARVRKQRMLIERAIEAGRVDVASMTNQAGVHP